MKVDLLFILLFITPLLLHGQLGWEINFEDSIYLDRVIIDTTSNPDNIWQIGSPQKAIFNSALSAPNAIVTDTVNPYPVNDTSSFTIIHIATEGWLYGMGIHVRGYYRVNSDTITDYGKFEFSADLGLTWTDADSSSSNNCCRPGYYQELPVFSGNSSGWKPFMYCLCSDMDIVNEGDTILYRFTFISDSIQSSKDGLMFDEFDFWELVESTQEVLISDLIEVFPNPMSSYFAVSSSMELNSNKRIQIINTSGQVLYNDPNFEGQKVNVQFLQSGVYYLKYSTGNNYSLKKIVVIR